MNDHHDPDWFPTGRCNGHCCRMITLSAPAETIAWMAAGNSYTARVQETAAMEGQAAFRRPRVGWNPDATFVEDNFILVRLSYVDGITGERTWHGQPAKPLPQYRCTKWTGTDCGVYESRPGFCRRYGGPEQPCRVEGCNLRWRYKPECDRWADDGGAVHERVVPEIGISIEETPAP